MSKAMESSLFMISPLAKSAEFYQQLLRGLGDYHQLGNRLIQLGEQAHSLRQFGKVQEIGLLLSNIPIKRYQAIGYYFLAVAANSMGNGDQNEARRLFELVIDSAPDAYKLKSILSLGALAFHNKDFDSAFYFYQETIRTGGLSAASLQAVRGLTTLKSIEGITNLQSLTLKEYCLFSGLHRRIPTLIASTRMQLSCQKWVAYAKLKAFLH